MEDLLYTQKEVAKILKVNLVYVRKLRLSGQLKFLKIGMYKCRKAALEEFLAKWEGWDITDPDAMVPLEAGKERK